MQDELTLHEAAFKMQFDYPEVMTALNANKKSKGEGFIFRHEGELYELVLRRVKK